MRIDNIQIKNYKKFENISIDFNSRMNVIIGNNGTGKTSILDALSIGIGSIFLGIDTNSSPGIKKEDVRCVSKKIGSTIDRQPQFPVEILCRGNLNKIGDTWTRICSNESEFGKDIMRDGIKMLNESILLLHNIRQGDENTVLPVLAYYGTGRLWIQKSKKTSTIIDNRLQGYTNCLSSEIDEKMMLKWFEKMTYIELQNGNPVPELQAVKKAIEESYVESGADVKNVNVKFDVSKERLEVEYEDTNGCFDSHPFYELSDGYRNTLSLIADVAYRMAILNPQFLGNVTKKTPGIVLIDEVDLHLHPIWQKRILKTLKNVFPLVQFIVTTHSPSIISSAKADELLILDGDSCRNFEYEVYGKDSNSVLTEIMETSERPDEVTDKFVEFDNLMDKGDYKSAENILNVLRDILGENDNGVISASIALDFQKDWDE
ncbi:MAG: AAA family ATPase [Lachnospiraceae bacterium]|nr:AAA family ATPase [Lachnospiraceae bacterium]